MKNHDFLFSGQSGRRPLCRRQYQEIVKRWIGDLGLPVEDYGTHSLRRTKASMLYAQTLDPAKVQIVLGQSSIASAQEYLGIAQEDALAVARKIKLFRASHPY